MKYITAELTWLRRLVNPPYSVIDIFTIVGLLIILLTIPVISLNVSNVRDPAPKAAGNNTPPCEQYGDADGDGDVDPVDSVQILRYDSGLSNKIDNESKRRAADVNGDGRITPTDSVLILRYDAGQDITFPVCADQDDDGFNTPLEKYLGTDPYDSCPDNTSDDAWPPDINKDGRTTMSDVLKYSGKIGAVEGDSNFDKRLDLVRDGKIIIDNENRAISDPHALAKFFNRTCSNSGSPADLSFNGNNSSSPTINKGNNLKLTWNSSKGNSPCVASGSWNGLKNTQGSKTLKPTKNSTYKLLCANSIGKTERTVNVNVEEPKPCTGTLEYSLNDKRSGTVDVNVGGNVTSKGIGLSNCTSNDKLYFQYYDFNSTAGDKWIALGIYCTLSSSGTCSKQWVPSDKLSQGSYPTRVILNNSGNGTGISIHSPDWVNVNIQQGAPPPTVSCTGSPYLSLNPKTVQANSGTKITATSKGFSNCGASNTQFFWIRPVTRGYWTNDDYFGGCNFGSNPNECSVSFDQPNGVGRYLVAVTYEPSAGVQLSDTEYLDVTSVPISIPPPSSDPGSGSQDEVKDYIRNYVGGQNVEKVIRTYGGYEQTVNIGEFLYGLAGCESGWQPYNVRKIDHGDYSNPNHWIWHYEIGLYQYQHLVNYIHPIANTPVPSSQYAVWEDAASKSGQGSDPWNYQDQVRVTEWKVKKGGGQNVNAWSCYNGGGWVNHIAEWW